MTIGALYKKLRTDICDYGGKGVSSQLCYSQYTAVEGWQMLFVGQICENMPHSPSCWECNQLETIMY